MLNKQLLNKIINDSPKLCVCMCICVSVCVYNYTNDKYIYDVNI